MVFAIRDYDDGLLTRIAKIKTHQRQVNGGADRRALYRHHIRTYRREEELAGGIIIRDRQLHECLTSKDDYANSIAVKIVQKFFQGPPRKRNSIGAKVFCQHTI
jgi:hypothetical protein